MIEGNAGVNCMSIARSSKDKFQDFDTYGGATSRSGQHLANAVAVENQAFILFSLVVSQAFAKEMTFEESSASSAQDIWKVEFDLLNADIECLRQLHDFNDFVSSQGSETRKRTSENWKIGGMKKPRIQTDELMERSIITTVQNYKQLNTHAHARGTTMQTCKQASKANKFQYNGGIANQFQHANLTPEFIYFKYLNN